MPRKEIDYSNTIIYKLCCKNPEIKDIYVGHTTDFTKRKCQHKYCCNNENSLSHNLNVYKFIRDNGNWDNWEMIMVEQYPCQNKLEAHERERHWLETLNAKLNCQIPTRTKKEWRNEHEDEIVEYKKIYYEINKEEISEKNKIYREENKNEIRERSKKYREQHKEQLREHSKKYREENIEQLRERKKKYYEENIEKIKEQRSQQIECECGLTYTSSHRLRHQRSNKHLELLKLKTET
jgi:hypothetical protein